MGGSVLKLLIIMTAYFIGRSRGQFQSCSSSEQCDVAMSCVNGGCLDPCIVMDCGPNTHCAGVNHRAECTCLPGYVQSPTDVGCRRLTDQCQDHRGCGVSQRCVHNECIDVCPGACGIMLNCTVVDHVPYCYGSTMLPQPPVEDVPRCSGDSDCESDRRCEGTKCVNPCDSITCRNNGSVCYAKNHHALCIAVRPPFGKSHYDEKQYYISDNQTSWAQAFHECWTLGMQFATVESRTEMETLKKKLYDSGRFGGAWLAGRWLTVEKDVYWVTSGSNVDHTVSGNNDLAKEKPDGDGCVAVGPMSTGWIWDTFKCNDTRYYACEYYNF